MNWARGAKWPGEERERSFMPGGSPQPTENTQFGEENSRKSKPFSLKNFARAWLDFAGFG
jgi:hypothetical protein